MRAPTIIQLAAAAAMAALPAIAGAAPLRAGGSLPLASTADLGTAERAATPVAGESELAGGLAIFAVLGVLAGIALIVVVASGGDDGRSPG